MRRIASEIRLIYYVANRTLSKKPIFGNPTNSTKRTSSVTFGNLRGNPSDREKSSILPKMIIFGNSANSVNETSLVTSGKIEECQTSSEIHYFGKTALFRQGLCLYRKIQMTRGIQLFHKGSLFRRFVTFQ